MHQDHLRLRDREQDEDVRQALAHTTNNQASFGGSLLKNNMDVEAAMEMQRHLDEGGLSLHLLCIWDIWVCTRCVQSLHGLHEVNHNSGLHLVYMKLPLGLHPVHIVYTEFTSHHYFFLGKISGCDFENTV